MNYRQLGNTGLKVSQLGFGAMRLPMVGEKPDQRVDREKAIPMIHRAFEAGVNYIDTAVGYCNQDSGRRGAEGMARPGDRLNQEPQLRGKRKRVVAEPGRQPGTLADRND